MGCGDVLALTAETFCCVLIEHEQEREQATYNKQQATSNKQQATSNAYSLSTVVELLGSGCIRNDWDLEDARRQRHWHYFATRERTDDNVWLSRLGLDQKRIQRDLFIPGGIHDLNRDLSCGVATGTEWDHRTLTFVEILCDFVMCS
jgi:hypothetical protein